MRAIGRSAALRGAAVLRRGGEAAAAAGGGRPRLVGGVAARAAKGFAELLQRKRGGGKADGNGVTRAPLKKGTVSPMLAVPEGIGRPPYAKSGRSPPFAEEFAIHDTEEERELMRASCRLAADVLDMVERELIVPGTTTDAIDKRVHEMICDNGAYPSPLNYGEFPKSVCTSLNECICHGIPDTTVLQDGDIINVDVTVFLNGYHGDTSRTFFVGEVSPKVRKLVETTREALDLAIGVCGPGVPFNKIGHAIHAHADAKKLGVVKEFVGHGVGQKFHCGPSIVHTRNNERRKMVPNQTFTIEPMLTLGSTRGDMWRDGWTVTTSDKKWTAQFEHTLLITEDGVEVLTLSGIGS